MSYDKPIFGFTKCKYCGNLTRANTYTCQACGAVLKERVESAIDKFSSQGRQGVGIQQGKSVVQQQGVTRQQGQKSSTAPVNDNSNVRAAQGENVFSSENRIAANSGYTQQHTVADSSPTYKGVEATASGVFSSDNRPVYGKNFSTAGSAHNNNGYEMFSSEKVRLAHEINEQNVKPRLGSDQNPYVNPKNFHTPGEYGTTVEAYVANNVFEFRKHRFAKRVADFLDLILGTIVFTLFVIVFIEKAFTSPHVPVIFDIVTFAVSPIVILFIFVVRRTWSKTPVYIMVVIIALYTLFMLIGISYVNHPEYRFGLSGGVNNIMALEPMVVFIPVAFLDGLCGALIITMAKFYTLWEAYQHRGEDAIEAKQSNGQEFIGIFKSTGSKADNVQNQ